MTSSPTADATALDHDALRRLLDRAGELKAELVDFGLGRRWARELEIARDEQFAPGEQIEEHHWIGFLDHFLLERPLPDGRTVLARFVAARGDLPRTERDMLLGWGDVVEGTFEVEERVGDTLLTTNVIDELPYAVGATMGVAAVDQIEVPGVLIARLVRVGPIWAISGPSASFDLTHRQQLYGLAAQTAMARPELCFRNPEKLARAREIEHANREVFLEHFGADLVVLPGAQFQERINEYWAECNRRAHAAAVLAGTARTDTPNETPLLQDEAMEQAETVAAFYDEREGLSFHPGFGRLQEAFADPDLLAEEVYRDTVLGFLQDPGMSATPLRRLAEADPQRASAVFARVLGRSGFRWERDGEALLRRAKPADPDAEPLPRLAPLGRRLTDHLHS
ncbi:MAG: hypothetical protein ACT4QF_14155 [Sporichthyaceae bacterium]